MASWLMRSRRATGSSLKAPVKAGASTMRLPRRLPVSTTAASCALKLGALSVCAVRSDREGHGIELEGAGESGRVHDATATQAAGEYRRGELRFKVGRAERLRREIGTQHGRRELIRHRRRRRCRLHGTVQLQG